MRVKYIVKIRLFSRGKISSVGSLVVLSLFWSIFPIQPIQASEDVNKVELITPALGSTVVPETLRLLLRFTGPRAIAAQRCDFDFAIYMLGTDPSGRRGLFSDRRTWNNPGGGYAGLIWMDFHDGKVIPNGIECFINLGTSYQSTIKIVDAMHKRDRAKWYLEDHALPSDENSIAKFVEDWQYLVSNPSTINQITLSTMGGSPFALKPITLKAISGATKLQAPMLSRGATLSTGRPLRIELSGAPNEKPKSVSIRTTSSNASIDSKCFLESDKTKSGSRTELVYACRIPGVFAGGQASVSLRSINGVGILDETNPITVSVIKSTTEKLLITASASECEACRQQAQTAGYSGVVKVAGMASWQSDDGIIPLSNYPITICNKGNDCSDTVTDSMGNFEKVLEYQYEYITEPGLVLWYVKTSASDLVAEFFGEASLKLPVKPKQKTYKPSQAELNFDLKLELTTKSKIKWGDTVIGVIKGSGRGGGTCLAQFQNEIQSFTLKAGQTKTIKFEPRYADNKKFAFNVGCGISARWWGVVFDPRYSWAYARVKTFKYVTMVVPSNLDG